MTTNKIAAIDVHAHLGRRRRGDNALLDELGSADAAKVIARANMANTRWTIVSCLTGLMPRYKTDVLTGNEEAHKAVEQNPGLLYWAIVNPLETSTFEQAQRMLKNPKCVGIKFHPEEHGYKIKQQGRAIFEFAARHQVIILTHSGHENSMPEDFVSFANDFPEVTLIAAHIGCTCDGDPTHQIRAIQASKHGNIYSDTSSSQNILPGLLEHAVKEIGPERILYGTDSPLYFAPMQRARINHAEISDQAKRLILHDNAAVMFDLD
jgi:hypothetical protein